MIYIKLIRFIFVFLIYFVLIGVAMTLILGIFLSQISITKYASMFGIAENTMPLEVIQSIYIDWRIILIVSGLSLITGFLYIKNH